MVLNPEQIFFSGDNGAFYQNFSFYIMVAHILDTAFICIPRHLTGSNRLQDLPANIHTVHVYPCLFVATCNRIHIIKAETPFTHASLVPEVSPCVCVKQYQSISVAYLLHLIIYFMVAEVDGRSVNCVNKIAKMLGKHCSLQIME